MIKKPNNELEYRIKQLFEKKEDKEIDIILDCVYLILFQTTHGNEIKQLYNLLDLETFVKILTFFDGKTVSFPKKSEIKEAIILSLCYYYKEIKNMNWNEIKKQFPFEISSIKFGLRIKSFNNFLQRKLNTLLKGE